MIDRLLVSVSAFMKTFKKPVLSFLNCIEPGKIS
jgi:hypothetical protein